MVLLESLIHHTLEKRSLIIKHVEEINIDRNLVSSRWIKYVPQVVFSPGKVSAVDGSFNLMAFRGFILYAVNAQSLVYGNDGFIDKFDKFEVELAYPTEYSLDFIKMSMSLMELTVLWESLEKYNPDFALVDGSLIAYLTRIFSRIKQGVDEE
ncbi:MAG TPA: DNA double-strand break repair nuclease NurA, partial [Thermoproteales archaeon]|nr:DNA double-strand break repair nuclease NurA [Thermoproteales archaeon]